MGFTFSKIKEYKIIGIRESGKLTRGVSESKHVSFNDVNFLKVDTRNTPQYCFSFPQSNGPRYKHS